MPTEDEAESCDIKSEDDKYKEFGEAMVNSLDPLEEKLVDKIMAEIGCKPTEKELKRRAIRDASEAV